MWKSVKLIDGPPNWVKRRMFTLGLDGLKDCNSACPNLTMARLLEASGLVSSSLLFASLQMKRIKLSVFTHTTLSNLKTFLKLLILCTPVQLSNTRFEKKKQTSFSVQHIHSTQFIFDFAMWQVFVAGSSSRFRDGRTSGSTVSTDSICKSRSRIVHNSVEFCGADGSWRSHESLH